MHDQHRRCLTVGVDQLGGQASSIHFVPKIAAAVGLSSLALGAVIVLSRRGKE